MRGNGYLPPIVLAVFILAMALGATPPSIYHACLALVEQPGLTIWYLVPVKKCLNGMLCD